MQAIIFDKLEDFQNSDKNHRRLMKHRNICLTFFHPKTSINKSPFRAIDSRRKNEQPFRQAY